MHVYERLRRVSVLQSQIRTLANKIALYKDSLSEQHTPFAHLIYLQVCVDVGSLSCASLCVYLFVPEAVRVRLTNFLLFVETARSVCRVGA